MILMFENFGVRCAALYPSMQSMTTGQCPREEVFSAIVVPERKRLQQSMSPRGMVKETQEVWDMAGFYVVHDPRPGPKKCGGERLVFPGC